VSRRHALLLALGAGALLATACSINVPHDYEDDSPTSCSVKCPGKGRASASCVDPRVPACDCEPAPSASCVEHKNK
jgi:hypothetical protein